MKWNRLAIVALMAMPLMGLADEPTTRPAFQKEAPGLRRIGPVRAEGPFRQGARADDRPVTDEEKQEALDFMKENFPVRYQMFMALASEGIGRKFREEKALPRIVERWRKLKEMERQAPEAYASAMRQAKLQDEAFGLIQAARNGDPEANIKLHEKVTEMITASLKDRQDRIERLEKLLKEQKDQLSHDQENKSTLIDDAQKRLENEADNFLKNGQRFQRQAKDGQGKGQHD